jgi:nitroreductase
MTNATEGEAEMLHNETLDAMMRRASIRKYKKDRPSREVIETVARAGIQAPFASQLHSILLSTKPKAPFGAPLWFTICVDLHKLDLFMKARGWARATNDLTLLMFGIQDAAYMAENMVIAAESLGMGSCFIGEAPYLADRIAEEFELPPRVMPLVGLVMGYPDEAPPPRPRYPLEYSLFEGRYSELGEAELAAMMKTMDEGYLAQDYYRKAKAKIPFEDSIKAAGREDLFTWENYSWTEHISRKWGQWYRSPDELLEQLAKRGFSLPRA